MKSKGKGGEKRQHNACYETCREEEPECGFEYIFFISAILLRLLMPFVSSHAGTSIFQSKLCPVVSRVIMAQIRQENFPAVVPP